MGGHFPKRKTSTPNIVNNNRGGQEGGSACYIEVKTANFFDSCYQFSQFMPPASYDSQLPAQQQHFQTQEGTNVSSLMKLRPLEVKAPKLLEKGKVQNNISSLGIYIYFILIDVCGYTNNSHVSSANAITKCSIFRRTSNLNSQNQNCQDTSNRKLNRFKRI